MVFWNLQQFYKNIIRKEQKLTKDGLIDGVIKSCNGDNLSKQLTGDILDAAFENIHKSHQKNNALPIPGLEPSQSETAKHERVEIQKLELKYKSRPVRPSALKLLLTKKFLITIGNQTM